MRSTSSLASSTNGKVGGKIGIENLIETETTQSRNHFALNVGAYGHTETLAQSSADRRSGLYHNVLIGVVQAPPRFYRYRPFQPARR